MKTMKTDQQQAKQQASAIVTIVILLLLVAVIHRYCSPDESKAIYNQEHRDNNPEDTR